MGCRENEEMEKGLLCRVQFRAGVQGREVEYCKRLKVHAYHRSPLSSLTLEVLMATIVLSVSIRGRAENTMEK